MGDKLLVVRGSREDVLRVIENYLRSRSIRYSRWDKGRYTEYRLGFTRIKSIKVIYYYSDGRADIYAPEKIAIELEELFKPYRLYLEGLSEGLHGRVETTPYDEIDVLLRDLDTLVEKYRGARKVFGFYKKLGLTLLLLGLVLPVFIREAIVLLFGAVVVFFLMFTPHSIEHKTPTNRPSIPCFTPIKYRWYKREIDERLEAIKKRLLLLTTEEKEEVLKRLERLGLKDELYKQL